MARRRSRHKHKLAYLAAAAVVLICGAFFYLKKGRVAPPPDRAHVRAAVGYKMEDRAKLEKLISEGAKDD